MLLETEALLKDMDVQGPSYPFDSVCNFLAQSLTIAAQDVRLYRMRLEDKVISWFVDNWKIVGNRSKMAPTTMVDALHLLETICGLSKRSILGNHVLLPQTAIVEHMMEESKVKIIQDFVLRRTLPVFVPIRRQPRSETEQAGVSKDKVQFGSPRGKERKLSAFFLRSLEGLSSEWELYRNKTQQLKWPDVLWILHLTAIVFESLLAFNGTAVNREVLQNAGKVISIITPLLLKQTWILAEKVLVAQAFEQLVFDVGCSEHDGFQEAVAPPGEYSGIKEQLLHGLIGDRPTHATNQDKPGGFSQANLAK
jgi:ataxia telangiectasia mutated family protein